MHKTAMTDKCEKSIYACEEKASVVESMSTCTSQGNQSEMYFGLMPSEFAGKTGYAGMGGGMGGDVVSLI
jgi:hypothetical protein